jgi:putative flippase GtrA
MRLLDSIRGRGDGAVEFAKYLVIGSMNAVLTGALYMAGLWVFHAHYLVCLVVSSFIGFVFTYVLNFVWVFRPEPRLVFGTRFAKYIGSNAGTFAANVVILYALVDLLGYDPFLAQLAIMFGIVAANFLLAKHWSLRRRREGSP